MKKYVRQQSAFIITAGRRRHIYDTTYLILNAVSLCVGNTDIRLHTR